MTQLTNGQWSFPRQIYTTRNASYRASISLTVIELQHVFECSAWGLTLHPPPPPVAGIVDKNVAGMRVKVVVGRLQSN